MRRILLHLHICIRIFIIFTFYYFFFCLNILFLERLFFRCERFDVL